MTASPIDRFRTIHASYHRTREALRLAHRFLRTDLRARRGTKFAGLEGHDFDSEFLGMQNRLDDAMVINLWVVFERFVIEHVTASWTQAENRPEPFALRLREKAGREIERWRLDDLLDLYKGWIDSHTLGTAKQVKSYRDWVAHRNPRKAPSAAMGPEAAYRALMSIVRIVVADEPGGAAPGS